MKLNYEASRDAVGKVLAAVLAAVLEPLHRGHTSSEQLSVGSSAGFEVRRLYALHNNTGRTHKEGNIFKACMAATQP